MTEAVYVTVRVTPTDQERFMSEYVQPLQAHNAAHGVEVLAGDPSPRVIEGEATPGITVILKFPSMTAFDAWYTAPEYQPLKQARIATTAHETTLMQVLKPYGAAP